MDREDTTSPAQDTRIRSLWKSLDTQGRGQLDLEGLKKGLMKIDHPLKHADTLLRDVHKAVDLDGDGLIQYEEFCQFVTHAEKELLSLFKNIDQDHNGKLSKPELRQAFAGAGVTISQPKLDEFFRNVDLNHDGFISFEEWRDFLLFIPADEPGLKAVFSYYSASVKVNPEGDVQISDETLEGLGNTRSRSSFLAIFAKPPRPRPPPRPPDRSSSLSSAPTLPQKTSPAVLLQPLTQQERDQLEHIESEEDYEPYLDEYDKEERSTWRRWKPLLTALLPNPGYFLCGGIAGIVSRTSTAPLDRLKVYLIAQTDPTSMAVEAAKKGSPAEATRHAARPLFDATLALWRAGGIRSLFAGNGLNVAKVMPESAIKFGSYEASKRIFATFEGHGNPAKLHPWSQFLAGGLGGIISQFFVYPVDTLKFRMQCETVEGGMRGNALIASTARKMWNHNGLHSFYRGLPMGLVGMFPYSALDLTTFEYTKRWIISRNQRVRGCSEEDAHPGAVITAVIGGFSGAFGASMVYPLNLLRTRLQTQGTVQHPRTYTGIMDVTRQTIKGEGFRGLFKGLTPNLLKVVPAVSITYVVYDSSKRAMNLS